jgi:UDP-N-acetylmuramoylalanine--D-glutamate ligase
MKITVIGAARSGIAAARLAASQGASVFVTDAQPAAMLTDAIAQLMEVGAAYEAGGHTDTALDADLVVVSPGVPPTNPLRQEFTKRGIHVISELEYASRHLTNRMVAVTGTNGKTTTTALITHVLNGGGLHAVSAGNIGRPLSAFVGEVDPDTVIVVEASSYQLDTIDRFRPYVSCILNISPDHLGYHGSYEQYVESKWKIFRNQVDSDVVVLNADDADAANAHPFVRCTTAFFSTRQEVEGAFVRGGEIVLRSSQHKEETLMPTRRLGLAGLHNTYNSLAAACASRAFQLRNEDIRDSLSSFSGVEHRLETVPTTDGIKWVNDSKATNVNAAWFALSSFDRPIIWIAGGRADLNDYSVLEELVQTNVKAIVCIGEEADAIFNRWCTSKRCVKAATMAEAVNQAADLAHELDIVLLSPACKSFDMFNSFEERGQVFKELVLHL